MEISLWPKKDTRVFNTICAEYRSFKEQEQLSNYINFPGGDNV
jgi:hypothetical protein